MPTTSSAAQLTIADIEPDDPRLAADLFPILQQLRPHLTPETFATIYREGHPQGLRYSAAYDGETCVAVAGWRICANTLRARKLYVDDLVTTTDLRGHGIGHALLAELTRRAHAAGCTVVDLDSGVQRSDAHHFYMREGYVISSFHFVHQLEP